MTARLRLWVPGALIVALAIAAGAWVAGVTIRPPAPPPARLQAGTQLVPPKPIPEFDLVDQAGQPFARPQLAGHWTLLFFGFTHCPAVCPITMALLADVHRRLADLPGSMQPNVVFVSVDPERDTPDVLRAYVQQFDPSFVGLTGTVPSIRTFATALGSAFEKLPMENGDYMMGHSSDVMLVDPQVRLAALLAPEHADAVAADYRRVVAAGKGH